jgi:PAS domain S-box-containing protein
MIDRETTGSIDGVIHLRARTGSPTRTISTFLPENLLPQDVTQFVQEAAAHMSERSNSEMDLPMLSPTEEMEDHIETTRVASTDSEQENEGNYDLKPPPPSVSTNNGEALAEQLFSAEHLDVILSDRTLNTRFTSFLNRYRPQANPILARYQLIQKAKSAIQYANAIAESLTEASSSYGLKTPAAILDRKFEAESRKATEELVNDALPAYVTHKLIGVVTECLVKEITGNSAPIMRDMVPGLAEVYCLTDPSVPDNPIVYASEEFYKTTQYGREYVIGRNCRFLQGPKSSHSSVKRLIDALASGTEVCETMLNYRRDGTPFINLLMISPLFDNKGRIRYFLGCQIDVTKLVEGGRGLESMHQLVTQSRSASRFGNLQKSSLDSLGELGRQLNPMELDTIRTAEPNHSGHVTPHISRPGTTRRRIGMEEESESRQSLWPAASLGSSGRMPGVYQNFMLVRPYPSLRITFTSPAMRIPGLVQSRFMDRVGGPQHVREGILEALTQGVGVTARISWLTHSGRANRNSTQGKPRWVHCTPLLGSDEQVGVWMMGMCYCIDSLV